MAKEMGILALIIILGGCAMIVLAVPALEAGPISRLASIVLLVLLVLGRGALWRRPSRWVWVLAIVTIIVAPLVVIGRAFGHVDVLSLLFHLQHEVGVDTFAAFDKQISDTYVSLTVLVLALYWLSSYTLQRIWPYIFGLVFVVGLNATFIADTVLGRIEARQSTLTQEIAQPTLTTPDVRPDIVMIYLEGVERTLRDMNGFRDVYSPLAQLADENIEFTSIRQIEGTGWSIAGEVATQCGLPLVPNGLRVKNGFSDQEAFLSSHTCLGDILADDGYENAIAIGSDIRFAGHIHFANTHNITHIADRRAIEAQLTPQEIADSLVVWVLDDQMVFQSAQNLYDDFANADTPVFLTVATHGPHADSGLLSRRCTETGIATRPTDLAESVACLINEMELFMDRILALRPGRPVVFVVMSDHLNHDPQIARQHDNADRANTVVFASYNFETPLRLSKTKFEAPGSMVDVYPTLLAYLGRSDLENRAGIGVSLFGDNTTLVARLGLDRLNAFIRFDREFAGKVWE